MADHPGRSEARKPKLPKLGESLRFYVDGTLRTRILSPGIERYRRPGGNRSLRLLATLAAIGAVALALWWFSTAR